MDSRPVRLVLGALAVALLAPLPLSARHLSLSPTVGNATVEWWAPRWGSTSGTCSISRWRDDYIYGARLEDPSIGVDNKKTQNDVHLPVGLGVPLGGH
jgi:hypothetical protein